MALARRPLEHVDTPGLSASARRFIESSIEPGTRAMYEREFRRFEAWCEEQETSPFPGNATIVTNYLAYLASDAPHVDRPSRDPARAPADPRKVKRGYAIATIDRIRAALSAYYSAYASYEASLGNTATNPALDFLVKKTLRGIANELEEHPNRKRHLRTSELQKMLDVQPDSLAGTRNRAILSMGFFGGFRRSELAALTLGDLDFDAEEDCIIVSVADSKTSKKGDEPRLTVIGKLPRGRIQPLDDLKAWIASIDEDAPATTPLFRRVYRTKNEAEGFARLGPRRLCDASILNIVVDAGTKAGLRQIPELGAHSLRSSMATYFGKNGVSEHLIMAQGGWKSTRQMMTYTRRGKIARNNPFAEIHRSAKGNA